MINKVNLDHPVIDLSISTSEKTSVKHLGRNTRPRSMEDTLIVRSIDIPYLICSLSALIIRYAFSFSRADIYRSGRRRLGKYFT